MEPALMFQPEVETRDPAQQRKRDDIALRWQLAYLFDRSPFYARKLRAAGFHDVAACGGLEGLPRLPFTEKDEIRASQAASPPFGDHLAADPRTIVRIYSTSGTTGDPCYMPVTAKDLAGWIEMSSRSYTATGLRKGMRAVSSYNAGPFVAGAALDTIASLGVCHIPVGTGQTARLIRAMQLLTPEALLCTPSYAVHLSELLAERGIEAASLGVKHICVAGEPGGGEPEIRGRLEAAFGAKVCEAMGIGDVSISLWGECEARAGMHFCGGDHVIVELVDPATGEPVEKKDGATGELVYTALTREAVPLLRFRSRDHVQWWNSRCDCGRTTPRVRCIGRTDDLVIVRGVNVFPSAVRAVVAGFVPHVSGAILIRPTARGVRQEPPLPVQVELGAGDAAKDGLAEAIERAVRAALVATVKVTLVPFGSIGRSEYKTKLLDFGDAT
ncbi:phenylacetate--CoA ligase family protein [Falsiroseomonas sp. HW251]|uniref:phenylacetate--CoA ligase family protein n=1 Tax=Falsiroseomonas sp. HW251 TaxID=3390998 RepID=UPI003D312F14